MERRRSFHDDHARHNKCKYLENKSRHFHRWNEDKRVVNVDYAFWVGSERALALETRAEDTDFYVSLTHLLIVPSPGYVPKVSHGCVVRAIFSLTRCFSSPFYFFFFFEFLSTLSFCTTVYERNDVARTYKNAPFIKPVNKHHSVPHDRKDDRRSVVYPCLLVEAGFTASLLPFRRPFPRNCSSRVPARAVFTVPTWLTGWPWTPNETFLDTHSAPNAVRLFSPSLSPCGTKWNN